MKAGRRLFPFLLLASFLSGCKPALPPSKARAKLNPGERRGYAVFQTACAECHYANTEKGLHGPGLQGLYHQRYLPSGAPANDERITAVVQHGRGMMPAFGDTLTEEQLGDLLAYLHTL